MQLFRTVCSTDWKSRPSHGLTLVGETNETNRIQILKDLMDEDVRKWQAEDIALDEDDDDDEKRNKRAAELIDDPDLAGSFGLLWKNEDRFEMQTADVDYRAFVDRMDGDRITTVYHFFGD